MITQDSPGIQLENVQGQANSSQFQSMAFMYHAGNAASVFLIEHNEINRLKDKLADLSSAKLAKDAVPSAVPDATFSGAVLAALFATECVGIIYNSKVIEKAIGINFDPNTIKTTKDLENVLKKVEASDVTPAAVSPGNWSLGAHWIMEMSANQFPNDSDKHRVIAASLRKGTVNLGSNQAFNGWLGTLRLREPGRGRVPPRSREGAATDRVADHGLRGARTKMLAIHLPRPFLPRIWLAFPPP